MNPRIGDIVERIKALEQELEAELDQTRENLRCRLVNEKIRFDHEILQQQRRLKVNLFRYALFPKLKHVLTAPFIYALLPLLLLLDVFASLYHAVCFPLLGIPKVKRSDYLIFDRGHLAYLNLLEKVNCAYCSYGTGLLAYLTEIVARTEQYWCPIKHARRILAAHSHYRHFTEFGDAESFRDDLDKIRQFKD
jgi:hypothetical protein